MTCADEAAKEPLNFIISYSGRVGSSALIDTLNRVPKIKVPIFEELDRWYLKEKNLLGQYTCETIHKYVEELLQTNQINPVGERQSVGFKWRAWGHTEKLADVFVRNDVSVFNLIRNDLVELASSLYLTNVVYPDAKMPQFALVDAKDVNEKQRILQKYRDTSVEVDLDAFFGICEREITVERNKAAFLTKLRERGVDIWTIFYEDFAYKRFHFLNLMLGILHHPPVHAAPPTYLTKVSSAYPSESFRNRNALLTSSRLPSLLRQWQEIAYGSSFEIMYV